MNKKISNILIILSINIFIIYFLFICLNNIIEKNSISSKTNYIEIPSINLIKIIKNTLDDTSVSLYEYSSFDDNNIILIGHNNRLSFKKIHNLNLNDNIILNINGTKKTYRVTKNIIIKKDDFTYFDSNIQNTLTLVTCVNNDNYRRIIVANS